MQLVTINLKVFQVSRIGGERLWGEPVVNPIAISGWIISITGNYLDLVARQCRTKLQFQTKASVSSIV